MTHCAESKENVKQPKREFFSLLEIAACELCLTGYLSHYNWVVAQQKLGCCTTKCCGDWFTLALDCVAETNARGT